MNILVINAGSSSLKFSLIGDDGDVPVVGGHYIGIGESSCGGGCIRKLSSGGEDQEWPSPAGDHRAAITDMLALLAKRGIAAGAGGIDALGHRIVHGGERFGSATVVTGEVLEYLAGISDLAPLHNPVGISCIESLAESMPGVPQYAVFDTAFHRTIPETNYLYALPLDLYRKYGIRKYGFHGINHSYVARRASEILGRELESMKIVTCHLGNGQSICAVKHGKSFDTSMGFTPLEGLPMGTRSGSFDPEIVFFLMQHGYGPEEIRTLVNRKSGLLGVSGVDSNYRVVEERARAGDAAAKLASDMLINRIICLIGAYSAEMGGIDAIVFTAGIGENSAYLRGAVLGAFAHAGVLPDWEANARNDTVITTARSAVQALIVPANEELQIAREVARARRGMD